jgi:hypothetical protein
MRIWLFALAGCWTGAPVAPEAPAPRIALVRPQVIPGGYFVQDLVTRRLETNAFDEGLDGLARERAVLIDSGLGQVDRRTLIVTGRASSVMTLTRPTLGLEAPDPRWVVQYCIDISGRVTSAHVETRSDDQTTFRLVATPSDRDALEKMRGWRFAPYFVAGKPVTACSFISYSSISS